MKQENRFRPLLATLAGLALTTASHGAAVIYEGFDYNIATLNGQGTTGNGLDGAWVANAGTDILNDNLGWGNLQTSGGNANGEFFSNRFGGRRTITAGTLATTTGGLLADDGVMWFSAIIGTGISTNLANGRLSFALAETGFNTGNFRHFMDTAGTTGVGFQMFPSGGGYKVAAAHYGYSTSTGFGAPNVYDNVTGDGVIFSTNGTINTAVLLVGRFTWAPNGSNDTLDFFLPDTNLNLGSVYSSLSIDVDQKNFDTLTFAYGDMMKLDEIRIGANYAAVTPVPEPSTVVLIGLSGLALLRRRR